MIRFKIEGMPAGFSSSAFSPRKKHISLFLLTVVFSFVLSGHLAAEESKSKSPEKPKVKASELWGIRRGPNFNKPKDVQEMTPQEALAEALNMQKKADDKRREIEEAVNSIENER